MRKVFVVAIMCLLINHSALAAENTELLPRDIEQTILRLLFTPIQDAIEDYYGQPRQYMEDKLVSVRKVADSPNYEVVVQVETFYGPHNPPYGIETMTFYISYGEVKLKDFNHHDESA